jgi:hypothetical protein
MAHRLEARFWIVQLHPDALLAGPTMSQPHDSRLHTDKFTLAINPISNGYFAVASESSLLVKLGRVLPIPNPEGVLLSIRRDISNIRHLDNVVIWLDHHTCEPDQGRFDAHRLCDLMRWLNIRTCVMDRCTFMPNAAELVRKSAIEVKRDNRSQINDESARSILLAWSAAHEEHRISGDVG